jgi:class 3 adenylate cyclase/CHASE3 domain sensor protein
VSNPSIGVRGRLLLAFTSISALAALGVVAALLTFADVGAVFERITRERVPTTLAALDLSRQAERIASLAPRILADETTVEQLRTDRIVRRHIARLEQLRSEVKDSRSNPLLISQIEKAVIEIRKNLGDLQTLREVWSRSSLDDPSAMQRTVDPRVETTAPGVLIPLPRDELLSRGQKMIQSNIEVTERLAAAVDRLIDDEKQQMTQAEANVAATQRNSTFVLVGIVAVSLVSSALIVWLYVGRSIVGRLTALSGSMLAIAGGNLNAPLPNYSGKDEITSMGEALRLFRDKIVENERLQRLKSFLAPQVAELIVTSGDESVLDSHRRDVAVLFCDLRGFTAFAEAAEPEEIMDFLRDYHESLGELVDKYIGTLERFTGDGLIVLFNDPLPRADPCLAAARLAAEMRTSVKEVVKRHRQSGNNLGFGVGIAYGYATLGRIGFKGRFDYTAIGSVVNLAARLCERAQANQILVDSKVQAEIKDHMQTEALGEFLPKGFSKSVQVFNIFVPKTKDITSSEGPQSARC